MISPVIITAPTVSPLPLYEIKSQLRIVADDEDDLLELYRDASVEELEEQTNQTFHETTLEIRLGDTSWPLTLPRATPLWLDPAIVTPTPSISVFYRDDAGVETAWTDFVFDDGEHPAIIKPAYGESFPSFTPYPVNPVRIRYKAGIPNDASPQRHVSARVKTCLLLMIGALYEHREEYIIADRSDAAAVFAANPVVQRQINGLRVSHAF